MTPELPLNWLDLGDDRDSAFAFATPEVTSSMLFFGAADQTIADAVPEPRRYRSDGSTGISPPGLSERSTGDLSTDNDLLVTLNPLSRAGKRYIDSHDGSRSSWTGRKSVKLVSFQTSFETENDAIKFPRLNDFDTPVLSYVSEESYACLLQLVQRLSTSHFRCSISSEDFPSLDVVNHFIGLYLINFHPIFPILHESTLDFNDSSLLLSLLVIGCRYTESINLRACEIPLDRLLRAYTTHVSSALYKLSC